MTELHKMQPEDFLKNYCKNFKAIMEFHNIYKPAVAKDLKISMRALEMIESGKIPKNLDPAVLFKTCIIFNRTPDNMFLH